MVTVYLMEVNYIYQVIPICVHLIVGNLIVYFKWPIYASKLLEGSWLCIRSYPYICRAYILIASVLYKMQQPGTTAKKTGWRPRRGSKVWVIGNRREAFRQFPAVMKSYRRNFASFLGAFARCVVVSETIRPRRPYSQVCPGEGTKRCLLTPFLSPSLPHSILTTFFCCCKT